MDIQGKQYEGSTVVVTNCDLPCRGYDYEVFSNLDERSLGSGWDSSISSIVRDFRHAEYKVIGLNLRGYKSPRIDLKKR